MSINYIFRIFYDVEGLIILLSTLFTYAMCILSRKISNVLGTLDHPGGRKIHDSSTPLMGGSVMCIVIIPAIFLLLLTRSFSEYEQTFLLSAIVATFVIAAIGIFDDCREVDPKIRLIYGMVVFSVVIFINPSLVVQVLKWSAILPPMGFNIFSGAVTVFAFLVLLNAVNMADGKNGLVIGLSSGWVIILMSYFPLSYMPILLSILLSLIILLTFNMRGLLFLGDGGAYGFATLIGLLAVHLYTMPGSKVPADSIALMFGIPAVDMLRLMFTRWSRGRSPFSADRDHFHHHLQDFFGWPAGLLVYLVLVLIPCLIDRLISGYGLLLLALVMTIYSAMVWWIHGAKQFHHSERT